jgi:tetratricopeptide (TPR) repeat protein
VVWGAFDFFDQRRVRGERWGIAAIALVVISLLSLQQINYWQNSTTLWSQALRITDGNLQVEKQLANALVMSRDTEQALPHLINIVRLDPKDTTAHVNLGACFAAQGRIEEATREFERVVQLTDHKDLDPDDRKFRTSAFLNLGFAYVRSRDYPNALLNLRGASDFDPPIVDNMITDFERSVATQPSESSYLTLSLLLRARGKDAQAASILEDAVKGNSEYVNCKELLNYLNSQPKLKEYSSGSAGAFQNPS